MCFLNPFIESKNHVNVPVHKIKLLWSISLWAKWQKDDIKRAKGLDIKVGSHYEKAPEACIEELCDAVRTNITSGSCDQQHPRLFGHFEETFFLNLGETTCGAKPLNVRVATAADMTLWWATTLPYSYLLLAFQASYQLTQYTHPPTKLRHCYVMCFGIVRSLVCHTFWV